MKRLALLFFAFACAAPTDAPRIEPPESVDGLRVVRPKTVTVSVTPLYTQVYPTASVQYVAIVRDGQGRVLTPSSWVWWSSDTAIAIVSQTGFATALSLGEVRIKATAYPPWRR